MATEKDIKEKWGELLQYAKEHATGEGFHRGYRWLQDSFNEYLDMSEKVPGFGMGGQPGSKFNREVLAGKIVLALGPYVGGAHLLDDEQLDRLKESLQDIVENPTLGRGLKFS